MFLMIGTFAVEEAMGQLTLDGNINESDWILLGTSDGGPSPGFGAGHEINALYWQLDEDYLYFAIAGNVQDGNSIILFIDTEPGGYGTANYGRDGAPAGINNLNDGINFNGDFAANYAIRIGSGSGNYFLNLYTLSGTSGDGGGPDNFLGDQNGDNLGANPANSDQTRGFEFRIPLNDIVIDESHALKAFAMYASDGGFLSNQFISRAGSGQGVFGNGPVNFDNEPPSFVNLDIISVDDGFFSVASNWNILKAPETISRVIIDSEITLDRDQTLSSLLINSDAEFSASDASSQTLSILDSGSLTNNGTFSANTGTTAFEGTGTVSGTISFNNVNLSGAVNFGSSSTLNGVLQILPNGAVVTNRPTYATNSTLHYNTGGSYNRSIEWPSINDNNDPFHVIINSNLNMQGHTTARNVRGNLTIESDRTLTMSGSSGGDIRVEGNMTNNGSLTANDRAFFFDGTSPQTLTTTDVFYPLLFIENEVITSSSFSVSQLSVSSGNEFNVTGGTLAFTGSRLISGDGDVNLNNFTFNELMNVNANTTANTASRTGTDTAIISVGDNTTLEINQGIADSGAAFVKQGLGRLRINESVTGNLLNIDNGTVELAGDFPTANAGMPIGIGSGFEIQTANDAMLEFSGTGTYEGEITVRERDETGFPDSGRRTLRFSQTEGESQLGGSLILNKALFVDGEGNGHLSGQVQNTQPFVKQGTGTIRLSSASFQSGLFIDEGKVIVDEDFSFANPAQGFALGADTEPLSDLNAELEIASEGITLERNTLEVRSGVGQRAVRLSDSGTADLQSEVDLGKNLRVVTDSGSILRFTRNVEGAGSLTKLGAGAMQLTNSTSDENTFSGGVVLQSGALILGVGTTPLGSGELTISGGLISSDSGANRAFGNDVIATGDFSIGGSPGGNGAVSFEGPVDFNEDIRTITTLNTANNLISGVISNGGLQKEGSGNLRLSGQNVYTGITDILEGALGLAGTSGTTVIPGDIRIDGGTLQYNSTANEQIVNTAELSLISGHFNIGARTETLHSVNIEGGLVTRAGGVLTITDSAMFTGGEIRLTTGSFNNSQIKVEGGLHLGGEVVFKYTPATNNTNALLLEGDITVEPGSQPHFQQESTGTASVNLQNGIRTVNVGQDAVLTLDWRLRSGSETQAGIVKNGDGILRLTNNDNSYRNSTTINAGVIEINTATNLGGDGSSTTPHPLVMNGGTLSVLNSTVFVDTRPFRLGENGGTIETGNASEVVVQGVVSNDDGPVSEAFTKTGSGTLVLDGSNTFEAQTLVLDGTLQVSADNRLGSTGNELVLNGGTFRASETFTLHENRTVRIRENNGTIDVVNDKVLSFNGVLTGDPGTELTKQGAGTLALGGDLNYPGNARISNGSLQLGNQPDFASLLVEDDAALLIGTSVPDGIDTVEEIAITGITLENGSELRLLENSMDLRLSSDISVADADIILEDNSGTLIAGPGRLLDIPAGADVTTGENAFITLEEGSAYRNLSQSTPRLRVEREFTGTKGWRTIGSPVATTYAEMFDGNFVTQGFTGSNFDDRQFNLLWWDETDGGTTLQSWRTASHINDNVSAGRGHFYYIFNGATDPDNSSQNYSDELPLTMSVTGFESDLFTDDFDFGITRTPRTENPEEPDPGDVFIGALEIDTGWNLVANPTASVLDWNSSSGWTKTHVDNTIYVWDPDEDDYLVSNGSTGTFSGRIAPFQAFWVHANDDDPALTLGNPAKVTDTPEFFGRPQSPDLLALADQPEMETTRPDKTDVPETEAQILKLQLETKEKSTSAFLMFSAEGRFAHDRLDAYRLQPMSETWLTAATTEYPGGPPLVINSLPDELETPLNLPLYVGGSDEGVPLNGSFTLSWNLPDNLNPDWDVFLMDHTRKEVLEMQSVNSRTFTHQTDPGMVGRYGRPEFSTDEPAGLRTVQESRQKRAESKNESRGRRNATAADTRQGPGSPVSRAAAGNASKTGDKVMPLPEHLVAPSDTYAPAMLKSGADPEPPRFSIYIDPRPGNQEPEYRPLEITLFQNYPNPFNPATTIRFSLPQQEQVTLEVFDLLGRRVAVLASETFEPGVHALQWDARNQASGVYLYRLRTSTETITQKMTLVR